MPDLALGQGLTLPLDAVTRRLALLATSGAGKSNAAVVMAEEMHAAGAPFYAIDPKGDWWGVRSSGNGKRPGLPVPIFGGLHGDIAIEPTAGKVIAETIARQRLSCVLDVSQFDTREKMYGFLADFATELLRRNVEPLHGFLDECHQYIPQTARDKGSQMRCLGAWERLITGGRNKGLGTTQISQRTALVNKNTLDIAECIVALRTFSPRDRDAIKGWLETRADKASTDEILASLPTLKNGEAWIYAPEWIPGAPRRAQFRRRSTFDSAATPKVGESITPPSTLADVDLAALGERMAETVERQRADDPRTLRERIRELEQQVERGGIQADAIIVEAYEAQAADLRGQIAELEPRVEDLETRLTMYARSIGRIATVVDEVRAEAFVAEGANLSPKLSGGNGSVQPRSRVRPPEPIREVDRRTFGDPPSLGKGERKILDVLADYPEGRTHSELAFLAGYSANASTVGVLLGRLRRDGLVEPNAPIRATAAGLAAVGGPRQRPTGEALLAQWFAHPRVGTGERKVLEVLIDEYPNALSHDELADRAGYSPTASTVGVILSRLRKLGLVDPDARVAAREFIEAIR